MLDRTGAVDEIIEISKRFVDAYEKIDTKDKMVKNAFDDMIFSMEKFAKAGYFINKELLR